MRVLLDTQALLWWLADSDRLGPKARRIILAEEPVVSLVVLWEIAIKAGLGKLEADVGTVCRIVTDQGFGRIGVLDSHLATLQALPWHHRDPFDRMLVAQSRVEGMPVLTSDAKFAVYGTETLDSRL